MRNPVVHLAKVYYSLVQDTSLQQEAERKKTIVMIITYSCKDTNDNQVSSVK